MTIRFAPTTTGDYQGHVAFTGSSGKKINAFGTSNAGSTAITTGIRINEVAPLNTYGVQTADGSFPDWIELYNGNSVAVDLGGWTLTDDPGNTTTYPALPSGTVVPANGYLLVYATTSTAGVYTGFELNEVEGGHVGLYNPGGGQVSTMDYGVLRGSNGGFAYFPEESSAKSSGTENTPVYPPTILAANIRYVGAALEIHGVNGFEKFDAPPVLSSVQLNSQAWAAGQLALEDAGYVWWDVTTYPFYLTSYTVPYAFRQVLDLGEYSAHIVIPSYIETNLKWFANQDPNDFESARFVWWRYKVDFSFDELGTMAEIENRLAKHQDIFSFYGHHWDDRNSANKYSNPALLIGFTKSEDGKINGNTWLHPSEVTRYVVDKGYKANFVMLNACASGRNGTNVNGGVLKLWHDAFGAQATLGWSDDAAPTHLMPFQTNFWGYIRKDLSMNVGVAAANADLDGDLYTDLTHMFWHRGRRPLPIVWGDSNHVIPRPQLFW